MEDRARKRRKKDKVEIVGRYVRKEFEGYGIFLGKVVSFADGLYRVDYEDGDFEDLETHEVSGILINESDFDEDYNSRKKKLDELVRKKQVNEAVSKSEATPADDGLDKIGAKTVDEDLDRIEASSVEKLTSVSDKGLELDTCHGKLTSVSGNGIELDTQDEMDIELEGLEKPFVDGDADSSSDSCEFIQVRDSFFEDEVPLTPPPELPSSSGNIGVPEESVSQLFSVYSFLRSFSIQLFLSPFKLNDFVGSLICCSSNTLMDAVHFSLLRALKRHLEMLSSDGAKLAVKCLRRLDWSLLDTLTWPVYLVEYLVVMGYAKGPEWQGFYTDVLDGEYYSISVTKKLMILQILCDDVMESAELRVEVDLREVLEVGSDINGPANPLLSPNGPRRVHPKYSKTSACKAMEAVNAKPQNVKSIHGTNLGSKVPEHDTDTTDIDQDGNSDECQLCGMDGTLICCDGCPSAYHGRCIGLNKMLIPDGLWFCPECTAKKMEPTFRISAGLRGAEVFGVDPYGITFLGICNHLLVLNVSMGAGSFSRYYNQADIPKVVQILCSNEQHKTVYSGISKSIMQYWEISEDAVFSLFEKTEVERPTATDTKEDTKASVPMYTPGIQRNAVEGENCKSSVTTSNVENGMLPGREKDCQELHLKSTSLETVDQGSQLFLERDDVGTAPKPLLLTDTKYPEQFGAETLASSGSISHCPGHSDLTQQSCAERSSGLDSTTCVWGNNGDTDKKEMDGVLLPTKNDTLSVACEKVEVTSDSGGISEGDKSYGLLYMGDSFKPQSYINQYFLGDIAASAAANFAVLVSEGKLVTEAHASSNPRKVVSANMGLQLTAFSSAAIRFIWPNSEKKLMEVPRERCGWCLACKAATTSRRGCLLNSAASNAIKELTRSNIVLRPVKNGEGSIPGMATYILYMAESLHGLLVGPFLSSNYRKKWRKEVEEASTCYALKFSLLELEQHIRAVAFSEDWTKLVDDWMVESSAVQNGTSAVASHPKRPGGRRNRKQAATAEVTKEPGDGDLKIVRWWRGGKLSKLVFQKGILPRSIIKSAARQGGKRKIDGIHYAEGSEIPKRSRRFAWRAAVEMSKNAPQLALQVRYLDLHLRWGDMINSEQMARDGKGTEAETSAYRNARICDKKIQESKISYGLVFKQKHLPSRVLKNTINVEQIEGGEDKLWLSETHVPLFLIKDYEQKAEKVPSALVKTLRVLSKLQRKQLKAFRRDIFSYLMHKEDKVDKCPCALCQEDLLLGDAVKCNECEGYCHKDCTSRATADMKDEVDYVVTCNRCYSAKTITLNDLVVAVTTDDCQSLGSAGDTETRPLTKSTISGSKSKGRRSGTMASFGLIPKKKSSEENGADFRMKYILLRRNGDVDPSRRPTCHLCHKPYNPDLMYVCCEDCQFWYHGDAVQLKESQIFDVVGFKCCKCRKTRSPTCPYADFETESRKSRGRAHRQRNVVTEPESKTISKPLIGWEFSTTASSKKMEEVVIEDDDPLLFSLERVEPISELKSDSGAEWDTAGASFQAPQKLPIRRHVKLENDPPNQKLTIRRQMKTENAHEDSSIPPYEESAPLEANGHMSFEAASPPQAEWDLPVDGFKDEVFDYEEGVNCESMEFEPHTYFSFTELLATDDNQSGSPDIAGDWVNSSGYVAPPSKLPEQFGTSTENNHEEVGVKPALNVPCGMCSQTEPAPELFCVICGMCIHNHCSPWIESTLSWGDSWRCGNCRDWA